MLTVEQIIEIKEKLKTEMTRRGLNGSTSSFGSLKEFGGEDYDFVKTPTKDSKINQEYGEKTINLLYHITDNEVCNYVLDEGEIPSDVAFQSLSSYIDSLSEEAIEDTYTSCRGACTGLCFGSCIGMCNGCSGKCDTGCVGCVATCGTGCAYAAGK